MAKISEMLPSSYLKQSDFDTNGLIVTVKAVEEKNVARENEPAEHKWIVYFNEYEKGMVLNTTNINALAHACGSDDTDDWAGKDVVVYVDPTIGYAGKVTGGLRIKKYSVPVAPKAAVRQTPPARTPAPARQAAPVPASGFDDMADDVPFISASMQYDLSTSKSRKLARYDY